MERNSPEAFPGRPGGPINTRFRRQSASRVLCYHQTPAWGCRACDQWVWGMSDDSKWETTQKALPSRTDQMPRPHPLGDRREHALPPREDKCHLKQTGGLRGDGTSQLSPGLQAQPPLTRPSEALPRGGPMRCSPDQK